MTGIVVRGIFVGALAGLLMGFDTAIIAGTTGQLRMLYALSPTGLGITVSSALWGSLLGALLAGKPGDRFGARDCLKVIALLYLVSSVGSSLVWSWPALLIFRLMAGVAVGASTVLAPVYVAEISPPRWRGAMVGSFQMSIVLGILLAYLCSSLLGLAELGAAEWRWKFAMAVLPSLLLFLFLYAIPNSPRWLALRGFATEARETLLAINPEIRQSEQDAILFPHEAQSARLEWRRHRKPIMLAFAIAAFNQLSGINAILYYINDIFAAAGFNRTSADHQAIIVGATNLIFTLIALVLIDSFGRRRLLLTGSVGLFAALAGTGLIMATGQHQDLLLYMLILFIAAFAFSQGSVIWVYISEIFPTEVRARGQSIGSSTHWLLDALIAAAFPVAAAFSRSFPFFFFAAMMMLQFIVVLVWFPETRRTSLEKISVAVTEPGHPSVRS